MKDEYKRGLISVCIFVLIFLSLSCLLEYLLMMME